jgi:hypothetical protein
MFVISLPYCMWLVQTSVKICKQVAPGLTVTLSDELPNPTKKGKVRP